MERRRPGDGGPPHSPGAPRGFDPLADKRGYDPRNDPRNPGSGGMRRSPSTSMPLIPLGPPGRLEVPQQPPKPARVNDPIAVPGTSNVRAQEALDQQERLEMRARRRAETLPPPVARKRKKPAKEPVVAPTALCRIVHVDDDLVVVDKAAGVPVTPSGAFRERSVVRALHAMGYPIVFPINLLDAEASGLVVLSRSEQAAHALRWNWRSSLCVRTYIAVAMGDIPGNKGKISVAIGAVRHGAAIRHQALPVEQGGRPASTEWQLQARGRGMTRVLLVVKQGRCHQIRIHFAAIGFPLVGDKQYGRGFNDVPLEALLDMPGKKGEVPSMPSGQIALHCSRIVMPHPTNGQTMDWHCSVPRRLMALMPGAWTVGGAER